MWGDNNGKPGNILYRKENQRPIWNENIYGFSMYSFVNPLIVSGTFYVGLFQNEMGSLNIGYDAVNNSSQYTFYNVSDEWNESQYDGSLMIRPVVGSKLFVGTNEVPTVSEPTIVIAPNPASGSISITLADSKGFNPETICLYDLSGRILLIKPFQSLVDVSCLASGMYFLQIYGDNHQTISTRLMIAR